MMMRSLEKTIRDTKVGTDNRGDEWSFKKYGSRKILVETISRVLQSHFLSGSVCLAVSIFSQSCLGISVSQSKMSLAHKEFKC